MNVLILTYKYPPVHLSGLEMGSQFMARHLSRRGHRVDVIVTRRDPGQTPKLEEDGVTVWRLPVLNIPVLRSIWELLAASIKIWRLKPDVIHGQALFPCGWLAGLWGKLTGARSVVYLYGRDVTHPNWLFREFFGRQTLRWCDRVLAATEHCRRNALKIVKRDIPVWTSGFEPPAVWPQDRERDKRRILFVGRLDEVKGLDILFEALSRIDDPWTLEIVGEGPLRARLETLSRTLRVDDRIEWTGRVENDRIYDRMCEASVLVLPSREEPYGVVLLEALACGCRVVASDVGGIPEIVTGTGRGRLVPVGDPDALAQALTRALDEGPVDDSVRDGVRSEDVWLSRIRELETFYV